MQFLLIEVLHLTDGIALHGAKLVIPSFTKGKTQLTLTKGSGNFQAVVPSSDTQADNYRAA